MISARVDKNKVQPRRNATVLDLLHPVSIALKEVLKASPEAATEYRVCDLLLRQHCGGYPKEVYAIVTACKHDVTKTAAASHRVPLQVLCARVAAEIHETEGITSDLAEWAVLSWLDALRFHVVQVSSGRKLERESIRTDDSVALAESPSIPSSKVGIKTPTTAASIRPLKGSRRIIIAALIRATRGRRAVFVAGLTVALLLSIWVLFTRPESKIEDSLRRNPASIELWDRTVTEWQRALRPDARAIRGATGIVQLLKNGRAVVDEDSITAAMDAIGPLESSGFYVHLADLAEASGNRGQALAILDNGLKYWPDANLLVDRLGKLGIPQVVANSDAVLVRATASWINSGVVVSSGTQLSISAYGSVHPCIRNICADKRFQQWVGPEGFVNLPRQQLPSIPNMALIGRLGDDAPFYIGKKYTIKASTSGELWLSVSDWPGSQQDNAGGFAVTINSLMPGPQVEPPVTTATEPLPPTIINPDRVANGHLRITGYFAADIQVTGMGLDIRRRMDSDLDSSIQIPLPPGEYAVLATSQEAFMRYERRVQIGPNATEPVTLPTRFDISVYGVPEDCVISIDGRQVRANRFDGRVAAGSHKITWDWPQRQREFLINIDSAKRIALGPDWLRPTETKLVR